MSFKFLKLTCRSSLTPKIYLFIPKVKIKCLNLSILHCFLCTKFNPRSLVPPKTPLYPQLQKSGYMYLHLQISVGMLSWFYYNHNITFMLQYEKIDLAYFVLFQILSKTNKDYFVKFGAQESERHFTWTEEKSLVSPKKVVKKLNTPVEVFQRYSLKLFFEDF